jgi:cytidylate kinase
MSNRDVKIAISGKSGCGNTTVSTLLAKKLGLHLVNYTFHTIARETGLPFEEICRQAELDPKWDYQVDETQVRLAREKGSVLGSRLAVWLLKDADLKVFLTASHEVRAARIHKREGGDTFDRSRETAARDRRDRARYRKLYEIDNNKYDFVDLIINTDHLSPEQIVLIIEAAVDAKAGRPDT